MNVNLNGNLAEIPAKHICFITPKKCLNRDKKSLFKWKFGTFAGQTYLCFSNPEETGILYLA